MTAAVVALTATLFAAVPPKAPGQAPFEAGQAAFVEGEFEKALGALRSAASQAEDDSLLAQIHLLRGQCYAALPDDAKAEEAFTDALEYDPLAALDPKKVRPSVVALLARLRQKLRAELSVWTDQPGSRVFLDGRELGMAPLRSRVGLGRHQVEVKTIDGAFHGREVVVIHARQSHELKLELTRVR
jgi:tetratricopeptide (TPR) repeat protein